MAERIFAKDRPKFMEVYLKATQVPYGYVLIDNQPCTAPEYQVVTDVFGTCQRHPILNEQPFIKRLCVKQPMKQRKKPEVLEEENSDYSESEQSLQESDVESFEDFSEPEESDVEDLQEEQPESEPGDFDEISFDSRTNMTPEDMLLMAEPQSGLYYNV